MKMSELKSELAACASDVKTHESIDANHLVANFENGFQLNASQARWGQSAGPEDTPPMAPDYGAAEDGTYMISLMQDGKPYRLSEYTDEGTFVRREALPGERVATIGKRVAEATGGHLE
jgi:hypothetical protein